jgi:hypothetical protein
MSQALSVQKKPLHKTTSKSPMGPTSTPPHVGPYSSNAHGLRRYPKQKPVYKGTPQILPNPRGPKSPKGRKQP